ncbi:glycosyltransferase [Thermodesulfovibrionales bacterium]|nr:glycosyltransferase [Thermodesulfovibrionales bacterium]
MKVLHISHLYPVPYDPLLGITMHKQIKTVSSKGYEGQVISPIAWAPFPAKYISGKWKLYSEIPNYKTIEGITVFHPRYLVFPKAFFLASSGVRMHYGIRALVKKIYENFPFDLIHAHMALPDGYAGMLLSQDYNRPLVVTFQATDLDITTKRNTRCSRSLRKVFAAAGIVISPSPRLSRALNHDFGIIPRTIGYGIDATDVYTEHSNLRRRYGTRRILLSASRLLPTKGIDLNLRALKALVARHKDLLYLVIGSGSLRQHLERLVDDLELGGHVEFIGQLPYRQVMEYMSICDIFTMPSWQETFGLVYIEAMAHAKPIIGVQGQGVDGIVAHGETGLLAKPRDVDTLVEAIDFLLSNPEKAKAMGERARKLVLENYTWEKNAEKTIKVYKEVLNVR